MLKQTIKKNIFDKHILLQIAGVSLLSLIVGGVCIWFSSQLALIGLLVIAAVFIMIKRPEIALLGILIATSSIVFQDQLPLLGLGGVSLHMSDMLLLWALGLILVKALIEPGFRFEKTPLDLPLLLFYGFLVISTLYAVFQSSVDIESARRAIRFITYYFTFFIATNLIRERRQLNLLLNGLFTLAAVVAVIMVIQFFLGQSVILLPGRVESLSTQEVVYEDITRILPPGLSVVLVTFLIYLCNLTMEKVKPVFWLKFSQFGLLGLALIFTFLRSYWGALLIVYFLLMILVDKKGKERLILYGASAAAGILVVLLLVYYNPDSRFSSFISASSNRLTTIFQVDTYQGQDESYQWRRIENGYALAQIAAHPIIGTGMAARYRPWDLRIDPFGTRNQEYDFRQHIHNGHLKILLNSGILGYLSLFWFSILFLQRGFKNWRNLSDPGLKSVVLGCTLAYLAVFISAWVNATFTQWQWTPVLGIILGINEVIYNLQGQEISG